MTNYIIRAALHDEENQGWVWMDGYPSRSVVQIIDSKTHGTVFCQVREVDDNFIKWYNQPGRIPITSRQQTIVMSGWYRGALGFLETTGDDNKTNRRELDVQPAGMSAWAGLRAASHHPDLVVRLSTRLGVLGTWLGIVGLVAGLAPLLVQMFDSDAAAKWATIVTAFAIVIGTGILGGIVCRGARRPSARNPIA